MKKVLITTLTALIFATTFALGNTTTENSINTTTAITEHETVLPPAEEETENYDEAVATRRFSSITEIGSTVAYGKPYFNIYQAFGMRVNPYFFIGQGVGLQVSNNNLLQLQATIDMRAYVLNEKVTPMFTVQTGINKVSYAPVIENKKPLNDLQFVMNAGTGILIKAREKASFTINGGYTIFTDFDNNVHGGFVRVGYVF